MEDLQVMPSDLQGVGSTLSGLSGPAGQAADDLQGRQVVAPGFQTAEAVTSATSAWSSALASLVSACQSYAAGMHGTAGTYQGNEGAIARSFDGS